MPDEIATRATLLLIGGIVAGGLLALPVSWAWRRAWQLDSGAGMGIAVGLAVFGAAMAWVVSDMTVATLQRSGHVQVEGTLLGFDAVTLRESRSGRKLIGAAPAVQYTLSDGQVHKVRGLSGSLQGREPGSVVPVSVDPRDPRTALVGDFQNLYAALGLFGLFAVLALLSALHTGIGAVQELSTRGPAVVGAKRGKVQLQVKAQAQAPPVSAFQIWRDGPQGQHWHTTLRRVAWATGAAAVMAVFVAAEFMNVARAMAITAAGLAVATALAGAAAALKVGAKPWMTLFGRFIAALGVGGFAAWLWLLTGR